MISERDEAVALEGKYQIRQDMAGQYRRKGSGGVAGFAIRDKGPTIRERHVYEQLPRFRV